MNAHAHIAVETPTFATARRDAAIRDVRSRFWAKYRKDMADMDLEIARIERDYREGRI